MASPVFDGTLAILSIQLLSPLFLQPSSWEGVFFLTFHQVAQLELGLCNPTVVEMEPGKEGRKSNVNFKAYSIVFFLTPSFVHL